MASQNLSVRHQFRVPARAVFGALSDHNNLGKVLGVPVRRVCDGSDHANGVGSVRALGIWPLITEETVTAVEVDRSIDYRITKGGAPLRNHRGHVSFSANASGTEVNWSISFDAPPLVGTLISKVLSAGISRGLAKLERDLN